jgi:hypothetical protein
MREEGRESEKGLFGKVVRKYRTVGRSLRWSEVCFKGMKSSNMVRKKLYVEQRNRGDRD